MPGVAFDEQWQSEALVMCEHEMVWWNMRERRNYTSGYQLGCYEIRRGVSTVSGKMQSRG